MKEIKKICMYLFGAFVAFNSTLALAGGTYGVGVITEPTLWKKILAVILSPICIIVVAVLVLVFGVIVYLKRKRKNAKKDS